MKEEQPNNLLIENRNLINDEKIEKSNNAIIIVNGKNLCIKKKGTTYKKNINRILYKCINNRHN